jgi:hypothetical protein
LLDLSSLSFEVRPQPSPKEYSYFASVQGSSTKICRN